MYWTVGLSDQFPNMLMLHNLQDIPQIQLWRWATDMQVHSTHECDDGHLVNDHVQEWFLEENLIELDSTPSNLHSILLNVP